MLFGLIFLLFGGPLLCKPDAFFGGSDFHATAQDYLTYFNGIRFPLLAYFVYAHPFFVEPED
jgi:hypothetical protein